MVEVLKGFSAGEQYATGNSFILKAELGKDSASHDH
jgi:cobalt-zinc-cadmium efflux system membrane fusion protein